MTKVAGIPGELQALAATLIGSSPELEVAASLLGSAAGSLPSMPGGLAARVEATLGEVRSLVQQSADTAAREADDLRRRGLWLEVADRIRDLWEPVAVPFGMLATPNDSFNATSLWRVSRLAKIWTAYERAVSPTAASEGEASLAALNAQLRFEEDNPMSPARFATVLEGAGDDASYLESLGTFATVADTVGKFTPVAGLVAGPIEFVFPKNKGVAGVADRAAGAGTFLGSGALLATSTGLIAVPGLGEVALAVVIVAGAWDLWENRDEVARLTVAGGKFIAHHAYALAGPAGIAAHEAWKYRAPIARALVSTAETGKNLAEDGATTILGGAESTGKSLASGAKSILGHVTPHIHVGGLSIP